MADAKIKTNIGNVIKLTFFHADIVYMENCLQLIELYFYIRF